MVPLRLLVKFYQFVNDKRSEPMEFLDLDRRKSMVRQTNKEGETPLHLAAAAVAPIDGEDAGGNRNKAPSSNVAIRRVASWLLESGADPEAEDLVGDKPKPVPTGVGQLGWMGTDEKFTSTWPGTRIRTSSRIGDGAGAGAGVVEGREESGGRPRLLSKTGKDLKNARTLVKQGSRQFGGSGTSGGGAGGADAWVHAPLLPPPSKPFGFTYVSFFFEKMSMETTQGMVKPFLTISVFNSKGKLTEAQQDMMFPTLESNHLWWAKTWNMQTPLETLEAGSLVVVELKANGESGHAETIAWGPFALDQDVINTRSELLMMYLPPTDPLVLSSNQQHQHQSVPTDMMLQGDVFLTRVMS
ncbi:unnamed protein product [Choristocarpus tenellus]